MRKFWVKIKHWIIKKLGGYIVAPSKELKVEHYTVKPITIHAAKTIYYEDLRRMTADNIDIKSTLEARLAKELALRIVQEGLYMVGQCDVPQYCEMVYSANVQILPPREKPTLKDFENRHTDLAKKYDRGNNEWLGGYKEFNPSWMEQDGK